MSVCHNREEFFYQLQALTKTLDEPTFVIDYDGRYLAVLGAPEGPRDSSRRLAGRTMQEVLPEEKWRLFLTVVRQAIDSGSLQVCQYQQDSGETDGCHTSRDDGLQWFQGRVFPVEPLPGHRPSAVWSTINISAQKKIEEQLKRLSDLDDLTGVFNRRYFLARMEREIQIAKRRSKALSMIFLDADHFKRINDRYGHLQGDEALKHLSHVIGGHLRKDDIFARVGGEEFAVICPATGEKEALLLANRICRMVAETPLETEQGPLAMTISLGVASLRPSDHVVGDLFRRADQALYMAKKNDRNQACAFSIPHSVTQQERADA